MFVPKEESVRDFKMLLEGELDQYPEQAFYMVGGVEEVQAKARDLEKVGV